MEVKGHQTHREPANYSSTEVCRLVGVTYRVLDYWLRTGTISLDDRDSTPGSGYHRRWTEDDVRRLKTVIAQYHEALDVIGRLRSGQLWSEAV